MTKGEKIKDRARALGFDLVGFVRATPVPDLDLFRAWLDKGYGATMTYLHRQYERRGHPERILPGVRSLVCVAVNYHSPESGEPIARYAHGEDYHRVMTERLKALEDFIATEVDVQAKTKGYVDTGPVLERSYAAQAGLGWIGKNTMLINDGLGSFFFIGEILTTLAFDDSEYGRPALDQCGTCTKCLDACPTGAFPEPGVLDSNKCISYLTIEYRGEFSSDQQKMVGRHVYGCDVCQEVCPYNDRISISPLAEFRPRPALQDLLERGSWDMSEEDFNSFIEESAMDRISFAQWIRNVRAVRHKG